jgi:hypothetical protein
MQLFIPSRRLFVTSFALSCALLATARAHAAAVETQEFPEYKLSITLPALEELKTSGDPNEQLKGQWTGKLGTATIVISLRVFPFAEFGFDEPEDVNELLLQHLRDPKGERKPDFAFEEQALVTGPFGFVPYSAYARGSLREGTKVIGTLFTLGGLIESHGYSLRVDAHPELGESGVKAMREFLTKGVVCKAEPRNPKWSDDEALERWKKTSTEMTLKKFDKPTRTAHYIILTCSSGGKLFGQKMEECYTAIQKMYPFPEVPGRKLMPVFLFRTPDEYYEYYSKVHGISIEAAQRSKGHASGDYYATWYEAPTDPVHIHEATHQIFRNRLRLGGGGSWFQEGVAEYIETKPGDRGNAARAVKKSEHMKLAEFVTIPSLVYSTDEGIKGGDEVGDLYKQAALLIEFLRESKWGKDKFQPFIHAVGKVPRNDREAIERAVRGVYGCDLAELEKQWIEYCKKR